MSIHNVDTIGTELGQKDVNLGYLEIREPINNTKLGDQNVDRSIITSGRPRKQQCKQDNTQINTEDEQLYPHICPEVNTPLNKVHETGETPVSLNNRGTATNDGVIDQDQDNIGPLSGLEDIIYTSELPRRSPRVRRHPNRL